ncbi:MULTISPECIES: endolytic transglycosylase MltG [unclassified Microbacterium]|uniref:endolytic transglycosylase MltG n=1 Tax=unclassified Microbacterium TaxID=2609290 RepID=UPI00097F65C2|nr:endolytic transglycosylase MltG [Microbacterium sp. JB110]RCS62903.1 endolytic transglycosylase MltG [Microbacterium sp. JB110]SJM61620.1 protein YceG like [Frigoribacterium sp. JB110]
MTDDPQSDEPGQPLSRREARERARAQKADEPVAEVPDDGEAQSPADEDAAPDAGGIDIGAAARHEDTDEPAEASAASAGAVGGAEQVAPEDAESESAATRRTRSDVAAGPARTMPEGSSIEALLHSEPEERPRKRGKGCLIAAIIVLVLVGGLAAGGVWAWNTYGERIQEVLGLDGPHDYEEGEASGEVFITVDQGDTGEAISPKLFDAGVTLESDSFTRYLRENGLNPKLYPGVYQLQQKMTSAAVVDALEDPENRQENTVQLPEGLTVEASITRISESIEVSASDLEEATADPSQYGVDSDSLEGWLFPATYTFDPDASAQDVVQRLVDRTRESLDSAGVPDEDVHEVLTIAAIIQREARFEDDFYKVSRVIHNRLDSDTWGDTNGLLQMDSTVQYGYGEAHAGSASTSAEARNDDNPWNTYEHVGLPAGPISNPGDLAIDAAMHPVNGPWLYFVSVNLNTGETKFATSFAEHEQNVSEWVQWCSENPDAGC